MRGKDGSTTGCGFQAPWVETQAWSATRKEQRAWKEGTHSQGQGWPSLQVTKCPWGYSRPQGLQGSSPEPRGWLAVRELALPMCPLPQRVPLMDGRQSGHAGAGPLCPASP